MSNLVWGGAANSEQNRIMADWAANIIWGDERRFSDCTTMGVVEDDKLIGVMVFHNYDPHAQVVEYSGASCSAMWLTRASLGAMFGYIFEGMGCQMAVTRNSEHNKRLHRQLDAYGHTPHRIERLRGPDESEIIWTLTQESWAANKFNRRRKNDG